MTEEIWKKAIKRIVAAGNMPFPITESAITLIQLLMTEEQADFISIFRKPSLSLEQLKKKSKLSEDTLNEMLESLCKAGIVSKTVSRSTGSVIYRLMPPFPGLFEYTLMKGIKGEKEKKIVRLFEKIFDEFTEKTQENYDHLVQMYEQFPSIDRVIPVNETIEVNERDITITKNEINEIIDNTEKIALTHCYCRIEKDLLDEPCKVTDDRENCLIMNKSADFALEYGFAREISKEEAKKILIKAEDDGLVHKIFHANLNPKADVQGICSCCNCCCGTFQLFLKGAISFHTLTSYLAEVDEDACTGCETCVEKCPMETITMVDNIAVIGKEKCIGCGVCAHLCPQNAIVLKNTGPRDVIVPPIKLKN